ncbi:MAG: HDOD domain-containing protein [Burkholderiales bacterium]
MSATLASDPAVKPAPAPDVDALISGIAIPPRPALLTELQMEMTGADPDFDRIARLVAGDVALTAAVLRTVNSPFYALSRKAATMPEAITLLGLRQIGALVTGFVLRKSIGGEGANLTRFWDVTTKRSFALARLARGLRGIDVDVAQTFGLFCDVGIALLMQRFPAYAATLAAANRCEDLPFTQVEQAAHQTDHALVGALMARAWGLPKPVCDAIRMHHDYATFQDLQAQADVTRLIAMGLVAELAIQRFAGLNESREWDKGGDAAAGALMLGDADIDEWVEQLTEDFASGLA